MACGNCAEKGLLNNTGASSQRAVGGAGTAG